MSRVVVLVSVDGDHGRAERLELIQDGAGDKVAHMDDQVGCA
jgi:hypothetical protein